MFRYLGIVGLNQIWYVSSQEFSSFVTRTCYYLSDNNDALIFFSKLVVFSLISESFLIVKL